MSNKLVRSPQELIFAVQSGNKYVLTEQLLAFLDFSGNFKRKFPAVPTRKLEQAEIKHLFALEVSVD